MIFHLLMLMIIALLRVVYTIKLTYKRNGRYMKISRISADHTTYPERLRTIPDYPKQLYAIGDLSTIESRPTLAVVGSRKVTPYGRHITDLLAREAAKQGIVIVSGLALGVDAVAHQAALAERGATVAVLPCGLDTIYPTTHHHLATQIINQGGALVSEYSEGTKPFKLNFIARNRIVAGLADAVLITEAASKSGTLHTANFALEQGRTVMAVPGNITSEQSRGTNNLIKMGATPVTDIQDILAAMNLGNRVAEERLLLGGTEEETRILQLLSSGISDASELLSKCGFNPALFNQSLTMLEINGKIRPLGAGHWGIS